VATGPRRPLPITDSDELSGALERLDPRERRVLVLRYGLDGRQRHSLTEVAEALGVSSVRVAQLQRTALWRLADLG
jgi:RNA polymerase sigma factor (sigma-70 family)